MHRVARAASLTLVALLAGCAVLVPSPTDPSHTDASDSAARDATLARSAWALASQPAVQPAADPVPASAAGVAASQGQPVRAEWTHWRLPGKTPTDFRAVRHDGRDALAARSQAAASLVRKRLRVEPQDLGRLRFSWQVAELIAQADMALREAEDSPVRIVLAFEGDRSKFSPRDAMLAEMTRAITGEEMPYATLMYVWCNTREPGTVIHNPRTSRIRKIVLESGAARLNRWLDYERDIRADYERAFGEAPGALVGIAVMTDTDNTRGRTRAWYGPVQLSPAGAAAGWQAGGTTTARP